MPTTSKASGVIWTLLWKLETGATDGGPCFFLLFAKLLADAEFLFAHTKCKILNLTN
jgi:hypothetical protein